SCLSAAYEPVNPRCHATMLWPIWRSAHKNTSPIITVPPILTRRPRTDLIVYQTHTAELFREPLLGLIRQFSLPPPKLTHCSASAMSSSNTCNADSLSNRDTR